MGSITPIYLFSLPRSGSTLLQRMLGAHTEIATTPEPWILLPQLYALRSRGTFAEYGHGTSVKAVTEFIGRLPSGRSDYYHSLRQFVLDVYRGVADVEAHYFLDKTPRYNLIAGEILEIFPDARCIALWRNPLAVVASILDTWLDGRWMPYHHKIDLFEGLENLLDVYVRRSERFVSVRYEDLVARPEQTLRYVISSSGLAWEQSVADGFTDVKLSGVVGDTTGVRAYQQVSSQPLNKWRDTLASPIRKAWCRRYLRWIGHERLSVMGYSRDELLAELDDIPSALSTVGRDAFDSAKGAAWSLLEPEIVRSKAARLPHWKNIFSHS